MGDAIGESCGDTGIGMAGECAGDFDLGLPGDFIGTTFGDIAVLDLSSFVDNNRRGSPLGDFFLPLGDFGDDLCSVVRDRTDTISGLTSSKLSTSIFMGLLGPLVGSGFTTVTGMSSFGLCSELRDTDEGVLNREGAEVAVAVGVGGGGALGSGSFPSPTIEPV